MSENSLLLHTKKEKKLRWLLIENVVCNAVRSSLFLRIRLKVYGLDMTKIGREAEPCSFLPGNRPFGLH